MGFDAKRALRNNTGLGNYSRYVIDTMSANFREAQFVLYGAGQAGERVRPLLERANVSLEGPDTAFDRVLPSLWRSTWLGHQAAQKVDVFHGLSNELPLTVNKKGLPSVVTVHDVIWRRFPSDYSAVDRRIYDYKYGRSARIADRVIAISECTRRDLINDFDIDPAKTDVIYQGVDPSFRPSSREAVADVRRRYRLPATYMVCVGTVQGRKNQLLAVRALRHLPASMRLVIVGRRTSYAREIDSYISAKGLTDRVLWVENASFADLPAIYSGAAVSVYPSRYEGFGLPVVESISCGTPVVAATGSCLEEAGGEGALYVSPDDERELAEAVLRITDDRYRHDKLVELGRRHVRKFSAASFAKKTMGVYRMALLAAEM